MEIIIITLSKEGGMVHYTAQLSNSLAKLVNVNLIVPKECNTKYFDDNINLKMIKIPVKGNWLSWDHFNILKVFKIIREVNPDVIHISGSYVWVIGFFFFLKIRKYSVVVTLHDVKAHYGEHTLINKITNYFYLKIADYVFIHGENLKKELLKEGFDKNSVSVIKHGDYSFFTKYSNEKVEEDGSILFFGRIEDYKGLKYLLKAIPLIKNEIGDINVIVAGRGDLNKYDELIEGNSNIEIINNYIEDELVAELFQRASVVAMPYVEGSQSGIIPIAYSFKKPVVVTDVGSIPEVVDDGLTGFIVPPRDVDALAEALLTILKDDDLREKMGVNCYKKMEEELSWDKISKETVEVYEKLRND
jgi:glycosyltransferase involved in cell wall biosynthesis